MKKGFTLIELLAVIIILAIVSLIATPKILDVINDARDSANMSSTYMIIDAARNYYAESLLDNNKKKEMDGITNIYNNISISGKKPDEGQLFVNNKGQVSIAVIYDDVCYKKDFTDTTLTKIYEIENCFKEENIVIDIPINSNVYKNGYTVYFNPTTGLLCDDYVVANSNDGNKNGCLKWYVFNDYEGAEEINLLLDHNTTTTYAWHSSDSSNATGPDDNFLNRLKDDTSSWKGVPLREDYYEINKGTANYKVDYNGYRARILTGKEIADIVGIEFDELQTNSWLVFKKSNTCNSVDDENCEYSFLYDRTGINCKSSGCLNNSQSDIWGYWTISPYASDNRYVWYIYNQGNFDICNTVRSNLAGIRPVITIDKNALIKDKNYSINYNVMGASSNFEKQVKYEDVPIKLSKETPKKDGYVFLGWATSENGEVEYQPNDYYTINKDITLYAKWRLWNSEQDCKDRKCKIGQALFFNPTTGLLCEDYITTNSNDGNKNGCLKWYIVSDNGNNLDLLLDHNTTTTYAWHSSSSSNATGPDSNFLNRLKNDTSSWTGVPLRNDYYEINKGTANYKVDYNGYRARILTGKEIADIVGIEFDELQTNSWLVFKKSNTCNSVDDTNCEYSFLYDRTGINCKSSGCLNNSQNDIFGYWTISPYASDNRYVWYIYNQGNFDLCNTIHSHLAGIRPVITIDKNALKLK